MVPDSSGAGGSLRVPDALRYAPISYDRGTVPNDLLHMEWELDDEFSDAVILEPADEPCEPGHQPRLL